MVLTNTNGPKAANDPDQAQSVFISARLFTRAEAFLSIHPWDTPRGHSEEGLMFLLSRWALPVWLLLAFKAGMMITASPVPQGATQGQPAPYFLRPSYDQALANSCAANDLGSCDLLRVRHHAH